MYVKISKGGGDNHSLCLPGILHISSISTATAKQPVYAEGKKTGKKKPGPNPSSVVT